MARQARADRGCNPRSFVARSAGIHRTDGWHHASDRSHCELPSFRLSGRSCGSAHLRHGDRARLAPGDQGREAPEASSSSASYRLVVRSLVQKRKTPGHSRGRGLSTLCGAPCCSLARLVSTAQPKPSIGSVQSKSLGALDPPPPSLQLYLRATMLACKYDFAPRPQTWTKPRSNG